MKRSQAEEAINLAMQGRWEEAVEVNKNIIELQPNDVEAYNRLGRALAELGRYAEAREAYSHVLELDPKNSIAKRRLEQLAQLKEDEQPKRSGRGINYRFFVEEANKSRIVDLCNLAPRETIAKIFTGEQVNLQVQGQRLIVVTESGEYLGEVEPKIGMRLIDLIKGGNKYQGAVTSLTDGRVKIMIRETFRHPSQAREIPFLPKAVEETRPYIKGSMIKYELEEEEELTEEADQEDEQEDESDSLWEDTLPIEKRAASYEDS